MLWFEFPETVLFFPCKQQLPSGVYVICFALPCLYHKVYIFSAYYLIVLHTVIYMYYNQYYYIVFMYYKVHSITLCVCGCVGVYFLFIVSLQKPGQLSDSEETGKREI